MRTVSAWSDVRPGHLITYLRQDRRRQICESMRVSHVEVDDTEPLLATVTGVRTISNGRASTRNVRMRADRTGTWAVFGIQVQIHLWDIEAIEGSTVDPPVLDKGERVRLYLYVLSSLGIHDRRRNTWVINDVDHGYLILGPAGPDPLLRSLWVPRIAVHRP